MAETLKKIFTGRQVKARGTGRRFRQVKKAVKSLSTAHEITHGKICTTSPPVSGRQTNPRYVDG